MFQLRLLVCISRGSIATKETGYSTSLSGISRNSYQHKHSSNSRGTSNNYTNDDSSIPTIDSDYNKLNSNFSVSDAGGTIGSRSLANVSHATSAFGSQLSPVDTISNLIGDSSVVRRIYNDDVYMSDMGYSNNSPTQLSHLIQPPTTVLRGGIHNNNNNNNYRMHAAQETFIINAPKGKLGVVIDTPISSHTGTTMPMVHAVKDSSPLANKIQVGDKLLAVDDEDVTSLTAIQVSKLLARKSEQEKRKLTIVRTMRGHGSVY
ncbi:hypothetical protein ACHAXM_008279 [Skeletonema potamos]|jgi:hypothetical protein